MIHKTFKHCMEQKKRIFALGFFDGVHLGHQALLSACCRLAGELGAEAAAITFDRHPQSFFQKDPPGMINSVQDRCRLLRQFGIAAVYQLPVCAQTMSTPWEVFLRELMDFGAAGFVCGDDFRFGCRGEGNAAKLTQVCRQAGIPCTVVPEQLMEGVRISSSHIRRLLEAGDMERAVRFLGHPHILSGEVISGRHLGRTLGIPTANLTLPEGVLAPKFGVYACRACVEGRMLPAVTNIGIRPTVGGHHVTVEPWILDFSGELYGRELTLEFYKFLRPERRFDSLVELQKEIRKNAEETREFFGKM